MRKKIVFLISIIALLFSFSCNDNKREVIEVKGKPIDSTFYWDNNTEIYMRNNCFYCSEKQSDSTFICLYVLPENKRTYFFSDTLNQMYVSKCRLSVNGLDTLKTVLISEGEWSYLAIDSLSFKNVDMNDVPFLYFSYQQNYMGTAIRERNVSFCLINMIDLSVHTLGYSGYDTFKCEDCIDGDFNDEPKSNKNPLILKKLKELSKESKWIYQKGPKDEDPYYYMNYETKWRKENHEETFYANGHSDIKTPIKSTYYKTNLFRFNSGVNDSIETDRYILVNYMYGNIVGYDKARSMYFPLLIESCNGFCDKKINFVSEDSLKISYGDKPEDEYEISMNDIIFDGKSGD